MPGDILALWIKAFCPLKFAYSSVDTGIPAVSNNPGSEFQRWKSEVSHPLRAKMFNTQWVERPIWREVRPAERGWSTFKSFSGQRNRKPVGGSSVVDNDGELETYHSPRNWVSYAGG
ncbi:hypothetical protein B0H19DRAFT_1066708 [Mycena capillaripes]|nr:hypothetical protein B0H19DRAFT_1066708 [Mycena capillaripes]